MEVQPLLTMQEKNARLHAQAGTHYLRIFIFKNEKAINGRK